MADEETQVKPGDPPKIVKKSGALFKWLGGFATVPLLLWIGNFLGGMVSDAIEHVNDLGDQINTQKTKIATLESNMSSREAIWEAITHNREKSEAEKDEILEKMHDMSVKYQAAMLLFERHYMAGGGHSGPGAPVSAQGHDDLMLESIQKALAELQKAESADRDEIKKLQEELKKAREQQSKMKIEEARQAEILEALKNVPGLRAKELRNKLDSEKIRKQYEEKFPVQQQQQQQFQKP